MDELSYINYNGSEIEIVDNVSRQKSKCTIVTGEVPITMTLSNSTRITDNRITEDMVVVNSIIDSSVAQIDDWNVDTYNGYLTIKGSISNTTNITLYLLHT